MRVTESNAKGSDCFLAGQPFFFLTDNCWLLAVAPSDSFPVHPWMPICSWKEDLLHMNDTLRSSFLSPCRALSCSPFKLLPYWWKLGLVSQRRCHLQLTFFFFLTKYLFWFATNWSKNSPEQQECSLVLRFTVPFPIYKVRGAGTF